MLGINNSCEDMNEDDKNDINDDNIENKTSYSDDDDNEKENIGNGNNIKNSYNYIDVDEYDYHVRTTSIKKMYKTRTVHKVAH